MIAINFNGTSQTWGDITGGVPLYTTSGQVGIGTNSPLGDLNIVHSQGYACTTCTIRPIVPALRLDELNYEGGSGCIGTGFVPHNIMEIWYNGGSCPSLTPGGSLFYSISVYDMGAIETINGNVKINPLGGFGGNLTVGNNITAGNTISALNSQIGNNLTVSNQVVIGSVTTPPGYSLYVANGILTEKLKVASSTDAYNWMDFVFDKKYKLRPLKMVEEYVKANKHLPEIPSALEVAKNGIDMVEMDAKLLQKIEELTLYIIQQQKEIDELKKTKR